MWVEGGLFRNVLVLSGCTGHVTGTGHTSLSSASIYEVERSSYQSNVAPKGDPHLSSVPHAVH